MTKKKQKSVETITHESDKRKNIPTAEYENLMADKEKKPIQLKYQRNTDLDPQLFWRGKDYQDWSDLIVNAPPLYIQEQIHPKHIIDDLMNQSKKRSDDKVKIPDLFEDMFDGKLDTKAKTEFYCHDKNWTNRMILGDSLQVMASLAERESLRGKIQCVYFDPPYGIKFGSNWQVSTQSRDVKDGKADQITREPEMVKAFRDTWADGIHSYLTYLRDRLIVARDLLHVSGSIFLQIGDENAHRVRLILDEVFGEDNFCSTILVKKTQGLGSTGLSGTVDYIHWYSKDKSHMKYKELKKERIIGEGTGYTWLDKNKFVSRKMNVDERNKANEIFKLNEVFRLAPLISAGYTETCFFDFDYKGQRIHKQKYSWKTTLEGVERLIKAERIIKPAKHPMYKLYASDIPFERLSNYWEGTRAADPIYVVQTSPKVVQNCLEMVTDPGDIVLDPTCGSGTTAYVAEMWGRRWITIDTSRVAIALAKTRIMSCNLPSYKTKNDNNGYTTQECRINPRLGFIYKQVPYISLRSIARNKEIDVIWDNYNKKLETIRQKLNIALSQNWKEWEIPNDADETWSKAAKSAHAEWIETLFARQREIDESIINKAETEYLYNKPLVDSSRVRVSGPFTVESLSPYKIVALNEEGELLNSSGSFDQIGDESKRFNDEIDFGNVILEHLRTSGVKQANKENRIKFTSVNPFPGNLISGDGRYFESDNETSPQKRAAIFIGPEYGTLGRADIVAAAREASELQFDLLVCCAFNYDAHSSEIEKLANLKILKAKINPDMHMANELKNTGSGNLFVVFGEPDIEFIQLDNDKLQVKINGVDVFHPSKGEVISGGPDNIAAWFIDTDYNEENFFVRHAYFLGSNDPYKQLKNALKAEVDHEAWESLYTNISRPFTKPEGGRIAVKVINHLGDEVMKVFKLD